MKVKNTAALFVSYIHKKNHAGRLDACWLALCMIFTILVSFSWDNALFASKANIDVV